MADKESEGLVEIKSFDDLEARVNAIERDNEVISKEIDKYYKIDRVIGQVMEYSFGIGMLTGASLGLYFAADELSSADICILGGCKIVTAICFGAFTAASYIRWAYKRQ